MVSCTLALESRWGPPQTVEEGLFRRVGRLGSSLDASSSGSISYVTERPPQPAPVEKECEVSRRLLLHICCGPCSTYTIKRLRELGFDVTGYWYNPNVHPYTEHERRRSCLEEYAATVGLPMIWEPDYDMPAYFRAVAGHEKFGERCARCYDLRLRATARTASERGFGVITTTLLISPYQDQQLIVAVGEEAAAEFGVDFFFENFRRGWSERGRLAKEHNLYRQAYCGCIFSEWERYDQNASTRQRGG
ncbi:MAG: epoxyqueuosine reductase QueH [Chloroflexi bacterium]|nr:epoxyqueuosine reductase QueH [Chloroflexota bacterium]